METQQNNQNNTLEGRDKTVSRVINYSERLEELIDQMTSLLPKDPYNSIENFNVYERCVNRFETLLSGYIDEEYLEELNYLEDKDNQTRKDKIKTLDDRLRLCMQLMKRRQFTPVDDTTGTSYFIVNDIVQRINDEYDAQIIVHGKRGTGKSTLCLRLAQEIADKYDLEFDVKKHVFFNSIDLRRYIADNKPPKGTPLIWDEAGAGKGMGKRRAMTRESIEYNEVIQVIREMGLVMFYTAPFEMQLDSGTLSMFSCSIETVRLDKIDKVTLVKYKILDNKLWKYLQDYEGHRLSRIMINKADQRAIDDYKKLKASFVIDKVRPTEDKQQETKVAIDYNAIKEEIIRDKMQLGRLQKKHKKFILDFNLIYERFKGTGLTFSMSRKIKRELEGEINGVNKKTVST